MPFDPKALKKVPSRRKGEVRYEGPQEVEGKVFHQAGTRQPKKLPALASMFGIGKEASTRKRAEDDSPKAPPNYRDALGEVNKCASCQHFAPPGQCSKYKTPVDANFTCDDFTPDAGKASFTAPPLPPSPAFAPPPESFGSPTGFGDLAKLAGSMLLQRQANLNLYEADPPLPRKWAGVVSQLLKTGSPRECRTTSPQLGLLLKRAATPRVRVVMPYEGKYLLERLANPKYPENLGKTRFPGGGVDPGETPAQTAVRELHEELGLRVRQKALSPLGVLRHPQWGHDEHHYFLEKHNLKPGVFKPTVAGVGDPEVHLVADMPEGPNYFGHADVNKLLQARLLKALKPQQVKQAYPDYSGSEAAAGTAPDGGSSAPPTAAPDLLEDAGRDIGGETGYNPRGREEPYTPGPPLNAPRPYEGEYPPVATPPAAPGMPPPATVAPVTPPAPPAAPAAPYEPKVEPAPYVPTPGSHPGVARIAPRGGGWPYVAQPVQQGPRGPARQYQPYQPPMRPMQMKTVQVRPPQARPAQGMIRQMPRPAQAQPRPQPQQARAMAPRMGVGGMGGVGRGPGGVNVGPGRGKRAASHSNALSGVQLLYSWPKVAAPVCRPAPTFGLKTIKLAAPAPVSPAASKAQMTPQPAQPQPQDPGQPGAFKPSVVAQVANPQSEWGIILNNLGPPATPPAAPPPPSTAPPAGHP
jgi:8-oxo-dGTP pyrophosphatase MutT (NUDIX family)